MSKSRFLKLQARFPATAWVGGLPAFCCLLWLCGQARALAADDFACGPHALGVASQLIGRHLTDEELSAAFNGQTSGVHTLEQLRVAAESLGLSTRVAHVDAERFDLVELPLLVVLHPQAGQAESLPDGHIVVLYGRVDDKVQVLNYPHGPLFTSAESLAQQWNGWGLYVGRSRLDFANNVDRPKWIAGVVATAALVLAFVCIAYARSVTKKNETGAAAPVRDSIHA